jgi:hypothetical protein
MRSFLQTGRSFGRIFLRAVQGISDYRVVVTIKYGQHSRTLTSELTRGLKKTNSSVIDPRLLQFRRTRLKSSSII